MNEEKIREIFDLCVRVSNETSRRITFDYKIDDDETMVYLYIFGHNGAIEKHFMLSQHYEFEPDTCSFDKAKEYLLSILEERRCPV